MKLSRLFIAAALAASGCASFAASLGAADLSSGSTTFGNTPTAGSFVDTLTFTLASTVNFGGSLTSIVNGDQNVDFSSIVVSGPTGSFAFAQLLPDPVEVWATPAGVVLGAGSYTLTLTGSNSSGIGSYGGNLAVSPVPEPQTLALMLAGVAVLGFVGKRRLG